MKPHKNSMDYQLNLLALEEMENLVPMTLHERTCIRKWVKSGHEIESNPWHYLDADGMPLNYLQAFRLKYGYPSGPWNYWKGPDEQFLWDDARQCFISKDEL